MRTHIHGTPVAYHVKQRAPWRCLLRPICWIIGHDKAWIIPLVPNPHALESWIGGCKRCATTIRRLPTP